MEKFDGGQIYNLYCIRDVLRGWIAPICEMRDDVAIREFCFFVSKDAITFANPKDFDLFIIGTFDSASGEIVPCIPRLVISGFDAHAQVMAQLRAEANNNGGVQ